jgi:hypothetical protein
LEDRSYNANRNGIPPDGTPVFTEDSNGNTTIMVGPEIVDDLPFKNPPTRTYWFQEGVH